VCNLYSQTKGQCAIVEFTRALRDTTGNLPSLPGVFPDYLAPIVRNAPDGQRETNIRNTKSPHWRGWLKPANRCVVPWTSFCEYADTKPKKTPTWFAFDETRPLSLSSRECGRRGRGGAA
jgi:putative SOS response-associated peptidase YedK